MAAYSVSWGAHKGNHNMQTSRRGVRLEALDDSMAVNKAIEYSAGEQSRISTRTLAWERPNERNNVSVPNFHTVDDILTFSTAVISRWPARRTKATAKDPAGAQDVQTRCEFAKLRFENSKATFTEHRHARHDNTL